MTSGETARLNYSTARAEILQRIQQRDKLLLVYLAAIAAVFGLAFGSSGNIEILILVPYLALGAAALITQHDTIIAYICTFQVSELGVFLKSIEEDAPRWESSLTLKAYAFSRGTAIRTCGQIILLLIPPVASLYWTRESFSADNGRFLWWGGVVATILCLGIMVACYYDRLRQYRETKWR